MPEATVAYAFLTEKDFIRIGITSKHPKAATLTPIYTIGDPWIRAYVDLQNNPNVSTNYYQRNLSVSSSPQAHILVTGQATGGGINVYRYHPATKELEKIWMAD
ncbi:MAG TPA: hypothetical protein DD638_07615 [Pasteurellaceae bacterium]|nr:hypothetical protein [Pasteurellaceae bacterium]